MGGRKHLISVNRTIEAAALDETGGDAAVVFVARNLARRMDATGDAEAPLSLLRSFQTAVKDLQRAAARKAPAKPVRNAPEIARDEPEDALTAFLRKWKVGV